MPSQWPPNTTFTAHSCCTFVYPSETFANANLCEISTNFAEIHTLQAYGNLCLCKILTWYDIGCVVWWCVAWLGMVHFDLVRCSMASFGVLLFID